MKFPIIRFNDYHLRKFRSSSELALMSESYFLGGRFRENAKIIDSEGAMYEILGAVRLRRSWNPLNWFQRSTAIIVELEIRRIGNASLEEGKNEIVHLVTSHGWNRQGGQDANQFRSYIEEAKSFVELFEKLSFYGKWVG